MRKNLNKEIITGRLYENHLEEKVSKKGVPYIGGYVNIAVDEEGLNVIRVDFAYIAEFYGSNNGAEPKANKNYPIAQNLIKTGKTWVKDGKDEATLVRCDCTLGVNSYVDKRDEKTIVNQMRNEGSFISTVNSLEDVKRNVFDVDVVINGVREVEATDTVDAHAVVHGGVFVYPNMLVPVDFIVTNPNGVNYFTSLEASDKNPIYTGISGTVESITKKTPKTIENAFGESVVEYSKSTSKAWVINRANPTPYDLGEENVLTEAELSTAIQAFNVHLAEVKKNYEDYKNNKNAGSSFSATPTPAASNISKAAFAGF